MAKGGRVDRARVPPSKPENIDRIGMMKVPMLKPSIMKTDIQSALGDLEYEAEVRPEFISPIGILGLDPKMTDISFDKYPFDSPQGFYRPATDRMSITDVTKEGLDKTEELGFLDKKDRKQHRAIKENPVIEHEAIHRGLQILADYYDYDEIAERFDAETADFLFENAIKGGRLASEVITELNDARRLGLKDYETFVKRFRNRTTLGGGDEELKLFMAKNLAYLPAMEELARERLYDRNPEGGPSRDSRGLAKGSLDKNFYKDKRVKKNILSDFVGNIRQKFKDFVTKKPDFEETSKQMPKEFNKGGAAMEQQMEMAFMQEGGLRDDGMDRDPVSGNEVPSGSLAEEVRDDIPAQLSEGEYVVPADVVRFFGIKFFEDLRMQAKMGLQNMEQAGRIGGEPIEESAEMLDPEDEMKIREMVKGFQSGGVSTGEDFQKDAEAKKFDFAKYSTPGGTLFGPRKPKLEGLVTYYHPDGREENVLYVNGEIVNEEQVQFTKAPWSTTKPSKSTPSVGTGSVSTGFESQEESSNRQRDLGGIPTTTPDRSLSTEDLARKYDGQALYFDAEKNRAVKMPELVYRNLQREYNTLGGAAVFDPNGEGNGFANYYKLPQSDKLSLLFENRFGEKPTKEQVEKLLSDSQTKTSFIDAIKSGGLIGLLMKIGGDRTKDVVSGVPTKKEPDLTTTEGRLSALRKAKDDRPFTAIDSPIYATGDTVTDTLTGQTSRRITAEDLQKYQDDIAKGTPLGDTRVGRKVTNFMQGFQTADKQKAKQAGVNVGDPVVYGTKADGSQGFKPVTDRTVANMEQNRRDVEEAQQASQDTFMQTGDAMAADRAYHESFTGFDSQGNFLGNEGGLASKPKAKPKRKRNTKGLGTKPKAT